MKKRILSILLSVLMILSTVAIAPIGAVAEIHDPDYTSGYPGAYTGDLSVAPTVFLESYAIYEADQRKNIVDKKKSTRTLFNNDSIRFDHYVFGNNKQNYNYYGGFSMLYYVDTNMGLKEPQLTDLLPKDAKMYYDTTNKLSVYDNENDVLDYYKTLQVMAAFGNMGPEIPERNGSATFQILDGIDPEGTITESNAYTGSFNTKYTDRDYAKLAKYGKGKEIYITFTFDKPDTDKDTDTMKQYTPLGFDGTNESPFRAICTKDTFNNKLLKDAPLPEYEPVTYILTSPKLHYESVIDSIGDVNPGNIDDVVASVEEIEDMEENNSVDIADVTKELKDEYKQIKDKVISANAAKDVYDAIMGFKAPADCTPDDIAGIVQLRADYDALQASNPEAFATIPQEATDKLLALEVRVAEFEAITNLITAINDLPTVDAVLKSNETAVNTANAAYTDLSTADKAFVTNSDKLASLTARIALLKEIETDIDTLGAAADVNKTNYTAKKTEYEAIDTKTTGVSEVQKNDIDTAKAASLQAVKDKITGIEKAVAVDVLVAALPAASDVTFANYLTHQANYNAAQAAYDALTADEKTFVDAVNVTKLGELADKFDNINKVALLNTKIAAVKALTVDKENCEQVLADIAEIETDYAAIDASLQSDVVDYADIAVIKANAQNYKSAKDIDDAVNALPSASALKLSDKTNINAIKTSYESADQAIKDLVDVTAYSNVAVLLGYIAEAEKVQTDLIDFTLAANVNKANASAIKTDGDALKAKINALQNGLKADVQAVNASEISNLNSAVAKAESFITVNEIDALIVALPTADNVHVADISTVQAAVDAIDAEYNPLAAEYKAAVTDYDKVTAVKAKLAGLVKVKELNEKIAALPEATDVTKTNCETVKTAVEAVEALYTEVNNAGLAGEVVGYDGVAAIKTKAEAMAAVNAVEAKIDALPNPSTLTIDNIDTVKTTYDEAKNAYDLLTDKDAVDAEKKTALDALGTAIANAEAAKTVNDNILALPGIDDIRLSNKGAVDTASNEFNSLTDDQEAYIPNTSVDKVDELQQAIKDVENLNTAIGQIPNVADINDANKDQILDQINTINTDKEKLPNGLKEDISSDYSKVQSALDKIIDLNKQEAQDNVDSIPNLPDIDIDDAASGEISNGSGTTTTNDIQDAIDNAQDAIDKIPDGTEGKDDLQDQIDNAQKELDLVNALIEITKKINALMPTSTITLDNLDVKKANVADIEALMLAIDPQSALSRLTKATTDNFAAVKARIADLQKVKDIIDKIENLPEDINPGNVASADETLGEFDGLTQDLKDELPQDIQDKIDDIKNKVDETYASMKFTSDHLKFNEAQTVTYNVKPYMTAAELKAEIKSHSAENIVVTYSDGTTVGDNDTVATDSIISVMMNGKKFKESTVSVVGDTNSDAAVDSLDLIVLVKSFLSTITLSEAAGFSANVKFDDYVDALDISSMCLVILGRVNAVDY